MLVTKSPPSSPTVTVSPDFVNLACGTVDIRDGSNTYCLTATATRDVNTPPHAGIYKLLVASQT